MNLEVKIIHLLIVMYAKEIVIIIVIVLVVVWEDVKYFLGVYLAIKNVVNAVALKRSIEMIIIIGSK